MPSNHNSSRPSGTTSTPSALVSPSRNPERTQERILQAAFKEFAGKGFAGAMKRYEYPRWQFTNNSDDIRELCSWALDLAEIRWRRSNWKTISVSTRAGVARLDELIGLKA